jgi:hypothetical protein
VATSNSCVSQIRSSFPDAKKFCPEVDAGARALGRLGVWVGFPLLSPSSTWHSTPRKKGCPRRVHASATVAASPFSCSALCILPVIPAPCSSSECGSSKNDHFRASLSENVHKQVSQLLHLGHCPCSSSIKRGSPPFRIVYHFRHDPRPLQKLQPIG